MGYKIKYPSRKKLFGCIIRGKQGEGKNWLLEQLAKIIGFEHYLTSSNIKDVIGDYAMGLFHKLIVNLNEMDLTSTKSLTNRFKSVISENQITFNPKHSNQFEAVNYALIIVTSNETCPISLDVMSGDRRWFIFEGNGANVDLTDQQWTQIFRHCEDANFTRSLYKYFMSLDYEAYDYKKEKQNNSKSEAYNKVAQLFIPYEYLFFKDWIIDQYFADLPQEFSSLDGFTDDSEEEAQPCLYYERKEFYEAYSIEATDLLRQFWDWSKRNKVLLGENKNSKQFIGKIMNCNFTGLVKSLDSKSRRSNFTFYPVEIMRDLIERGAYDDDMSAWKQLDKKGEFQNVDNKEKLAFVNLL